MIVNNFRVLWYAHYIKLIFFAFSCYQHNLNLGFSDNFKYMVWHYYFSFFTNLKVFFLFYSRVLRCLDQDWKFLDCSGWGKLKREQLDLCFCLYVKTHYALCRRSTSGVLTLLPWLQFLRKMAQPYDKTGGSGKKTLLSQEDLEKMGNGNHGELLFWGTIRSQQFMAGYFLDHCLPVFISAKSWPLGRL